MADELTIGASFEYDDGTNTLSHSKTGLSVDVTGRNWVRHRQTVGTAEEVLSLGDVAAGGWFLGVNTHATATIEMRPATGETDLVSMKPGEPALFRISSDATAPYVIASAAADLDYVLIDD